MTDFFNSLSMVQLLFFSCATLGGGIFFLRLILMLMGAGGGDDGSDLSGHIGDLGGHGGDVGHHDADSSFKLLSLHGLTAFFMMFGLVGLALSRQSLIPDLFALVAGVAAGMCTVWLMGKVFAGMKKLQSDGTMRISNAIGQEGKVYLTIPAEGTGQVQVVVQGQLRIFDAVCLNKETVKTGERVTVIDITGANMLVVEKTNLSD